jgi:uncharacterized delta-60 repeat protein
MKNFGYLFIAMLLGLSSSLTAQDASGDLDLTFNGTGEVVIDNGYLDLYQDVKMTSDGRIIAVGTTYDATYAADIEVTLFKNDGTLDPEFGTGGVYRYHLGYETGAYACYVKEDGNILVAGYSMDDFGGFEMVLLQLTAKGVLDPAFGNGGVARYDYGPGEDMPYGMAVQEDGMILLAGTIRDEAYNLVPAIVRFTPEGILDTTFGNNGLAVIPVAFAENEFAAVQVQKDGRIVAAGHIGNDLTWFSLLMARFEADGSLDTTFADNGILNLNLGNVDDEFFDLRITSAGNIVATGFTTSQGDYNFHLLVMQFDQDGVPTPYFGNEGLVIWGETSYNVGYAMEVLADDKIVIAGSSGDKAPGDSDWGIWKLNADGTLDPSFGNGGLVTTDGGQQFDEALGITVQDDGKLVAAGKFRINDNINFAVARYLNELTVGVPEIPAASGISVSPNPVSRQSSVTVSVELTEQQQVSVQVINLAGKVVMEKSLGTHAAGMMTARVGLSPDISSGIYFLCVKGAKAPIAAEKIMVVE